MDEQDAPVKTTENELSPITELQDIIWSDLTFDEDVDETTGERRMRVQGVVQEANIVNQNKRMYPKAVLAEAVRALESKMGGGRVFGEVDHPDWRGKLKDSSHLLKRLWWKDAESEKLMGEMLVFNTPAGEIIQEILLAGGRPGFSSRGKGQSKRVKKKGVGEISVIEPGYRFDSIDFVIDPSVRNARVTKIIEQALGTNSKEERMPKEKENKNELTVEKLKEDNPDLVKDLLKEERETIRAEVKKEVEKELKKDEAAACETRITDLEAELGDKEAEIERHISTINAIVELLKTGEYVKKETAGTEDADKTALTQKVAELEREIETQKTALANKETELTTQKAERVKEEAQAYLAEKTETHPYKAVLRDKLKEVKTKEEVDAGLATYAEFITALDTEAKAKGKTKKETEEEQKGEGLEESVKKRAKVRAGMKTKKEET